MHSPVAHISGRQQAQALKEGHAAVDLLIQRSQNQTDWKEIEKTSHNVTLHKFIGSRFHRHNKNSLTVPFDSIRYYRSHVRIQGSLSDVIELFQDTQTGESGRHLYDHKKTVSQMRTLYSFPQHSSIEDCVSIKWLLNETSSSMSKKRDTAYLECRQRFQQIDKFGDSASGHGYAVSINSVDVPFCPDLKKSHGIIRGVSRDSGYVFLETEAKNYLDVFFFIDAKANGQMANFVLKSVLKDACREIYKIEEYILRNRLSKMPMLDDLDFDLAHASNCEVCSVDFKKGTTKHSCRICGQVSCLNCIVKKSALVEKKNMDIKLCSYCFEEVKTNNPIQRTACFLDDKYVSQGMTLEKISQAVKEANDAIELLIQRTEKTVQWKQVKSNNDVSIHKYKGTRPYRHHPDSIQLDYANHSSSAFYRSKVRIQATLDEVITLFEDNRTGNTGKHLYDHRKDWKEMKTLYQFPDHNSVDNSLSIKWAIIRSNTALAKSRDVCYIECKRKFAIESNPSRKNSGYGYAISMNSVDVPFCPGTSAIIRGSTRDSGYVFFETDDPQYVDGYFFVDAAPSGNVSSWVMKKLMKERCKKMICLSEYIQSNRLSKQKYIGDVNLPSTSGFSNCELCCSQFNKLKKKFSCRMCAKVSCSKCIMKKKVRITETCTKKLAICTHCIQSLRTKKIFEHALNKYSSITSQNSSGYDHNQLTTNDRLLKDLFSYAALNSWDRESLMLSSRDDESSITSSPTTASF